MLLLLYVAMVCQADERGIRINRGEISLGGHGRVRRSMETSNKMHAAKHIERLE